MAKYKAGDKVKVIGQGIETIVKVYPKGAGSGLLNTGGVDWYEMSGGGMITDEDIERVANACKNAKFKIGDKVTDGSGVYLITGIDNGFGSYEWKLISGRADPSHSEGGDFGWADAKMKIANACRNASFKVGDKVTYWMFDKKLDGSVKAVRGERVDIDDGHGGVVTFKAKDLEVWNARACNAKFIKGDFVKVKGWPGTFRIDIVNPDGTYVLKKYPGGQPTIGSYKESELELEEANAKACNSRNPIVAKALNACGTARNGSIGEDAALGISYAREAVAKLNSAVPLVEKWIASGKGHPNAVADGKRLVAGIKKAVAILNPLV